MYNAIGNILAMLTSTLDNADSYKVSHFEQYPDGTEFVSSYIESRSSQFAKEFGEEYNYAEFFGLQAFLKDYLSVPIDQDDIDLAEILYRLHGEPFNKEGWQYILDEYDGKLPVRIRALPEGTVAPVSNAMVEIINTDKKVPWLTSYVETALLRAVWYPTTVATQSRIVKDFIKGYMDETSDNPAGINFMLHDFGARGATTTEASAIGGMAHLVNFMGTDTVMGMMAALRHYEPEFEEFLQETPDHPKRAMIKLLQKLEEDGRFTTAFSVRASEHSTMTIKGREGEYEQVEKLINFAKQGNIVSIVSDSYDHFDLVTNGFGGNFKDDIIEAGKNGGKVVVRPDSGDPCEVTLKTLQILDEKFGTTVNSKGYKVLPPYIGVLWGDGIGPDGIKEVMKVVTEAGYSAENLVFGMGGGLLQKLNRDHLNFALKASFAQIRDKVTGVLENFNIFKDPITAKVSGFVKQSKKGLLSTVFDGVSFLTKNTSDLQPGEIDRLGVCYENGEIVREQSFNDVRAIAEYTTDLHHNPPTQPVADPWKEALKAA